MQIHLLLLLVSHLVAWLQNNRSQGECRALLRAPNSSSNVRTMREADHLHILPSPSGLSSSVSVGSFQPRVSQLLCGFLVFALNMASANIYCAHSVCRVACTFTVFFIYTVSYEEYIESAGEVMHRLEMSCSVPHSRSIALGFLLAASALQSGRLPTAFYSLTED